MNTDRTRSSKRKYSLQALLWITLAVACFAAGRYGGWGELPSQSVSTRIEVPVGKPMIFSADAPIESFSIASGDQAVFGATPISQSEIRITGIAEGGGALVLWGASGSFEVLAIDVVANAKEPVIADNATDVESEKEKKKTAFKMLVQKSSRESPYVIYDLKEYVALTGKADKQQVANAVARMKSSILQSRWNENGGSVAVRLISDTELIVGGSDADHEIIRAYWQGVKNAKSPSQSPLISPTK